MTYGVMMKTTMQVAILMVEPAATITTTAGLLFARYLTQNLSGPKLALLILYNLVITNFLESGHKMPTYKGKFEFDLNLTLIFLF